MQVMDCGAIYDRFRKTGGLSQLPMCRETYKSAVFHEIRCSCCMRSGSLPPHVIFRGAGEELADVADGAVQDALAAFDGGPGDVRGEDAVFACRRGLSVETTSSAAAATLPLFSASARSCSATSCPRALLTRITPSFILSMFALQMIFSFSGVRLQCRAITSEAASSVSRSTYSPTARPASVGKTS